MMNDFFSNLPLDEEAAIPESSDETRPGSDTQRELRPWEALLLKIPGVEGFAPADDHVVVYVRDETVSRCLPDDIEGAEVRAVVTGAIRALGASDPLDT